MWADAIQVTVVYRGPAIDSFAFAQNLCVGPPRNMSCRRCLTRDTTGAGTAPSLAGRWWALVLAMRLLAGETSSGSERASASTPTGQTRGELHARIVSAETRQPIACTVTIIDANGDSVTETAGFPAGFRSTGTFTKQLPAGRTKIRAVRGPEFKAVEREIELRPRQTNQLELVLERQVDLRQRRWFAGDSHVHMIHGEKRVPVDFDQVALAARAEDLQYLCLGHAWRLADPTPERLAAELGRRSTPECVLTWNLEAPKNYYKGDAGRCLGHCWTLGLQGRTATGGNVIALLLNASAWDYESEKPSFANFESDALIHAQGGVVFYTHPARWWTGPWGGQGGYPRQEQMRVSNMAVELPLDVLAGPTFDGLDILTGAGELAADQKSFRLWSLLLNHGYRLAGTASSDACFDRPGGAVPGAARLYTFVEGEFSITAVARAAAQGKNFVTTGPLLVASVDGQPPGTAFAADGRGRTLRVEAWSSGAVTNGLARMEILRNGELLQKFVIEAHATVFQTNLVISEDRTSWYCVRAVGADEPRQRAISGAFYFDEQPWHAPAPAKAKVRVRVIDAASDRALDATLTEVNYLGTEPHRGTKHYLPGGSGELTIPATARLEASAAGYEPATLSPFFDHAGLIDLVTRLGDDDLIDWGTFERIRALLEDVPLTFRLVASRGLRSGTGLCPQPEPKLPE